MTTIKNEIFTLAEDKNQLLFYRNDGQVLEGDLNDFEEEVRRFFECYMACQMMAGEIPDKFNFECDFEMTDDKKCICLTVFEKNDANQPQPNIFKRLIKRIFG